ncbi:MAG: CPBP family intramembrane metalloprotease [Clostridiales bacterium]|nr:CPBP family intramembrane metalloprotease [Clostridiales bacterium]
MKKNPGILQVSILFSVVVLLFIMVGVRAQNAEFNSGVLISEFGVILLPAALMLVLFRYDFKSTLRLNRVKAGTMLLVIPLMAFAIPVAGVFNVLNLWLVNTVFGKIELSQPPSPENPIGLLISILVIAGSAGICEEFLFRGVIQKGLERLGAAGSILLTAFLFSLTHMDFQKILGTFVLGALIGFIVYRTNSLFSGMLAHFTNNALAVLLSYASVKASEAFDGLRTGAEAANSQLDMSSFFNILGSMPKEQLMIVAFVYGFMFLFFAAIFILLIFAFVRMTAKQHLKVETKNSIKGLLWLVPGIVFINVVYFLEIMKFRDVQSGLSVFLRSIMGL